MTLNVSWPVTSGHGVASMNADDVRAEERSLQQESVSAEGPTAMAVDASPQAADRDKTKARPRHTVPAAHRCAACACPGVTVACIPCWE